MPAHREVHVQPGVEPLVGQLLPGTSLRWRLLDEWDIAVPDATVVLEQSGEHRHLTGLPYRRPAPSGERGK